MQLKTCLSRSKTRRGRDFQLAIADLLVEPFRLRGRLDVQFLGQGVAAGLVLRQRRAALPAD